MSIGNFDLHNATHRELFLRQMGAITEKLPENPYTGANSESEKDVIKTRLQNIYNTRSREFTVLQDKLTSFVSTQSSTIPETGALAQFIEAARKTELAAQAKLTAFRTNNCLLINSPTALTTTAASTSSNSPSKKWTWGQLALAGIGVVSVVAIIYKMHQGGYFNRGISTDTASASSPQISAPPSPPPAPQPATVPTNSHHVYRPRSNREIQGQTTANTPSNTNKTVDWPRTEDLCSTYRKTPAANSAPTTTAEPKQPYINWDAMNGMKEAATTAGKTFISEIVPPLVPGLLACGAYGYFKAPHESGPLAQTRAMLPMIAGTSLATAVLLRAQPNSSVLEQKTLVLIAAAYVASAAANKARVCIQGTVIPAVTGFTERNQQSIKGVLCSTVALGTFAYFGPRAELTTPIAAAAAGTFLTYQAIDLTAKASGHLNSLSADDKSMSKTDIGSGLAITASPILVSGTKLALEATNLYPHSLMDKLPDVRSVAMSVINMAYSATGSAGNAIQSANWKAIGVAVAAFAALGGSYVAYKKEKKAHPQPTLSAATAVAI